MATDSPEGGIPVKVYGFVRGLLLTALIGAWVAGTAEARNPHCAGGIQYVVQAMRDKDKGNTEDYNREINKAVQQLQQCSSEDPADGEAIGYLGWAYCEVDSPGPAGRAFDASIKALQAKGDVKKVEWVTTNRNSYWARWFNEGISKIQDAQKAYADFCKKPDNDADATLKAEAEKNYQAAEASLTKAALLIPADPRTARNLASVYALRCDFVKAEAILKKGLEASPNDSSLTEALRNVTLNLAGKMTEDKNYDQAIATYGDALKRDPKNADLWISIASAHFNKAQTLKDDPAKGEFKAAGEAYGKASELKPAEADLAFNAALAYQNARDNDKALSWWEKTVKLRPDDTDAKSAYAALLVESNRCNDAIQTLHPAVVAKPQDPALHRQLGAIYTKCGNSPKGTEELMIYLTLSKGKPAADAASSAKAAKQGSDAAKTLASEGVPEQVVDWEADQQKWQTWFYWGKKKAYHFNTAGALSQKSDWSQPVLAATSSSGTKK
jgi:Flp pilus assembly protein TadD